MVVEGMGIKVVVMRLFKLEERFRMERVLRILIFKSGVEEIEKECLKW